MSTSFDHLSLQPHSLGEYIDALPTFDFPPATETVNGNVLVVSSGQFALYASGFTGVTPPPLHPDVQAEVERFNADPKHAWLSLIADAARKESRTAYAALAEAQKEMNPETRAQRLTSASAEFRKSSAHFHNLLIYLIRNGIPVPEANS